MPDAARYQTIYLHPEAPAKPAVGAACNGCGVCCAIDPCPIGVLVSRRRHGRCEALLWQESPPRYLCGVLSEPTRFSGIGSPTLNRWLSVFAARSIAAGAGCDASAEITQQPALQREQAEKIVPQ